MRFPLSIQRPTRRLIVMLLAGCLQAAGATTGEEDPSGEEAGMAGMDALRRELSIIEVQHLRGQIKLDGVLDEPFWRQVRHFEIERESYPARLAPSPVRTEVFFARLNDDLVIGFKAHDPNPEKIQAPLRDRDGIERDDYVGVSLDLAGKMLTTYEFYVSASGTQADWVRNRVANTRLRDWDAHWSSAARQTEMGYTVEMRIPLEELEISVGDDDLRRVLVFKRHYPRDVRHHLGKLVIVKPVADPILPVKTLTLVPSISYLNEWSRDAVNRTDWESEDDSSPSLDLEYKPTPSLSLFGTLNPNYLEVEADLTETSINDPFTSLVPEKRPFFTQGAETFDTLFDLIYTRNVESPRLGLKMTGSIDEVTTGNFVVDDRDLRLIVPGNLSSKTKTLGNDSLSAAIRQRYDMARNVSAGLIGTVRAGQSDYHNVVSGVDFYAMPGRHDEFRAQWVYADTQYPEEITDKLEEGVDDDYVPEADLGLPGETRFNEQVLRADPETIFRDDAWWLRYRHSRPGGYVSAQYRDVGEDFRADLGYMPRVDYRMAHVGAGLDHYLDYKDRGKMRFRLSGGLLRQESQAGEFLTESRDVWLNHWGLLQSWVRIGYRNRDRVARRIRQDTLAIEGNAPEFNEEQVEIRIESSPLRNGRLVLACRVGDQIDTANNRLGDLVEFKPQLIWNVGTRFEIALEDTYRELEVDEGTLFSENYLRLSLTYQFEKAAFFRLTVIDDWIQRDPDLYLYEEESRLERDTSLELLFAWKPSSKNAFLIGTKAGATDEDELANPRMDDMAVYIKYVKAFGL